MTDLPELWSGYERRTVNRMDDLISRRAAIDALNDEFTISGKTNAVVVQDYIRRVNLRLHDLPSAQPESSLITWLLDEIWDEDAWELNWRAFPEILCRKLKKLGYITEKDGAYVRTDVSD